jgi:hypothetical protein
MNWLKRFLAAANVSQQHNLFASAVIAPNLPAPPANGNPESLEKYSRNELR